jgi:hypothetical protein
VSRVVTSKRLTDRLPIAVLFHEEDRSPVSGLRFGRVEVLLAGNGREERGFLPSIGAEAVARGLSVPLIFEGECHSTQCHTDTAGR